MASRISQMRNEALQQQQRPLDQQQLNESIKQVKYLMNTLENSGNPQAMFNQLLGKNQQLATLAKQPNLRGIAEQMALQGGFNLNEIISQLQS